MSFFRAVIGTDYKPTSPLMKEDRRTYKVRGMRMDARLGKYEGQGAFLPLYPVCGEWQELLHAPLYALQDFVCVCPRKVTVLADGGKRE